MLRLDCTDAHTDLDLCCRQYASGPFSCIAHHLSSAEFAQRVVKVNIYNYDFCVVTLDHLVVVKCINSDLALQKEAVQLFMIFIQCTLVHDFHTVYSCS